LYNKSRQFNKAMQSSPSVPYLPGMGVTALGDFCVVKVKNELT